MKKMVPFLIAVGFWIAFIGCLQLISIVVPMLPATTDRHLIAGITGTLIVAGLTILFLKVGKQSRSDIGLTWTRQSMPLFLKGLLIGAALCVGMILVVVALAPLEIKMVADPDYLSGLGMSFAIIFWLAFMEEIAYRSYPLVKLQAKYGVRVAIYVSSIAFAFYHGWSPWNLIGPGVWGLFYGLMAVYSKGIALPLGLHVGLNWVQTMLGMKQKYVVGVWELNETSGGVFSVSQVGLGMQIALLLLGIGLIEWYVRHHHEPTTSEATREAPPVTA